MDYENEQLWTTVIPINVTQSKRYFGFRLRNLIEGLIAALIIGFLISLIHFVPKVQAIVTIGVSGSVFVFNAIGIKGMSVTECLINLSISKGSKKIYHLRSIKYAGKDKPLNLENGKTVNFNESIAEKLVRLAKEAITDKTQNT